MDDNIRSLFFGDYLKPDSYPKVYDEITDLKRLTAVMEYYLEEFNNVSKAPMSLVMFRFAIEHISRICRVLKQNKGHLLLVGIGGSGRQSASRLSTFMNAYELYQIEISKSYSSSDWREDLKKVMLQAGVATKSTVFLFADNQIKDESFVEDINMLLNTGDVPNIFPADEKADLVEKMQTAARTEGQKVEVTPLSMYNFFIERVKKNLHIVLGKRQQRPRSPVGDPGCPAHPEPGPLWIDPGWLPTWGRGLAFPWMLPPLRPPPALLGSPKSPPRPARPWQLPRCLPEQRPEGSSL